MIILRLPENYDSIRTVNAHVNQCHHFESADLLRWCAIPAAELPSHPQLRVPFRMVADSAAMIRLMPAELIETIEANNGAALDTRVIIPCGPSCW